MFENLKDPFFILANPRSGSSLLRLICDSNENIIVPPESGFLEWWYKKYSNWEKSWVHSEYLAKFIIDLASSKKFETWDFDSVFFESLVKKIEPSDYSELISLVYYSYAQQQNKNICLWGDKNNYFINKTDIISKIYPNAKYIHLIRDGRDVAVSYKNIQKLNSKSQYKPVLPASILEIANEWVENINKVNVFLESIKRSNQLVIRYEDLVMKTEEISQKISEFLDVPYDSKMLLYYEKNNKNNSEPKATLDWKKKTLEKPDESNIGKYKKELSLDECTLFEKVALKTLKNYTYV